MAKSTGKIDDNVEKIVENKNSTIQSIEITKLTSEKDIDKYLANGKIILNFTAENFKQLKKEQIELLNDVSRRSYILALAEVNKMVSAAEANNARNQISSRDIQFLDPLKVSPDSKLRLRKRTGFVQTWKRPGEVDEAKSVGYSVVRKQLNESAVEGDKDFEEPGSESGEVIKLYYEGKLDLVAMEIHRSLYEQSLKAIALMSKQRLGSVDNDILNMAEEVNKESGTSIVKACL